MLARIKFTIGLKIYLIIGLCLIALLAVTGFGMEELSTGLQGQKRLELKHLAEVALSIVKEEHAAAEAGRVSDAEARTHAAARLATLRYDGTDYFWINDMHPTMVMHPTKPELNGKDLSENKDPNGKKLFVEMADVVKRDGAGYVAYEWPKPGKDKPQPKLSYVVGYQPWGWIIGTGVYVDDLDAEVWSITKQALLITAMVVVVAGAVATFVARRTSRAIGGMTRAMRELASGNFELVLPGLGRRDEIGEMAGAVESFKRKTIERARAEADEEEAKRVAAARARNTEMQGLADAFQATVGSIVDTVSSTSGSLDAAANSLSQTASETEHLSDSVTAASEQASSNVQYVATATESMTISVREIARQVGTSSEIAGEAVKQAERTDARISDLSQAANRIGDVIKLITAIAEQTNLLALNATIEAARAGEAGRGFAVVALEVKALASQTAKATDEIVAQISGMQEATAESVTAIKEITATIASIARIATETACAVEEQHAATEEIARNVGEAAASTAAVATNIAQVNRGATETRSAATQVLSSAQSLSGESHHLKVEVERFLATVRAA
jgi:methyl-accepting chemotaxis protein